METNEGFVFYRSFYEALDELDPEEYNEAVSAMLAYVFEEELIEIDSKAARMFFKLVKPQIDANAKRRANGSKGGRPKTIGYANEKPLVLENEPNEKPKEKDKEKEKVKDKEKKNKYGEYQHVALTDGENQKLIQEYGQIIRDKAVTFLDEYIEDKHYKSKSHYLAIRRWVVDAVRDHESKGKPKPKQNFEGRTYDFAALERGLITDA